MAIPVNFAGTGNVRRTTTRSAASSRNRPMLRPERPDRPSSAFCPPPAAHENIDIDELEVGGNLIASGSVSENHHAAADRISPGCRSRWIRSLNAAGGEAGNELALHDEEKHDDGCGSDHGPGHDQLILGHILARSSRSGRWRWRRPISGGSSNLPAKRWRVCAGFDRAQNARLQGLGISLSAAGPKARPGPSWTEFDAAFSTLGHQLGLATYVSSEAAAACSAELIYGLGAGISDFAYVFVADSLSGGLVQNGNIRFSRDDVGSNMGRVLVPAGDGTMVPLRSLAGLSGKRLADAKSLELIARGVAYAVHSAASVVHHDVVIVDGALPQQTLRHLVLLLRGVLAEFDDKPSSALSIREGSRARKGATLGAACLPLVDRFYPS